MPGTEHQGTRNEMNNRNSRGRPKNPTLSPAENSMLSSDLLKIPLQDPLNKHTANAETTQDLGIIPLGDKNNAQKVPQLAASSSIPNKSREEIITKPIDNKPSAIPPVFNSKFTHSLENSPTKNTSPNDNVISELTQPVDSVLTKNREIFDNTLSSDTDTPDQIRKK